MLALLAIALVTVGLRVAEIPIPVLVALGALGAYTALSYLSILWAAVPGDAWEGANRTLLYLLVFALFACWRQRGASAALLLCAWTLALIALAVFAVLRVNAAGAAGLQTLLPGARLAYPTGYPNANAAQWLMAFWPAVLLARSERLPWGVRGLLAGGAVLLAEVALLSQSRGSLYATPVMLVLVFALIPGRTRTFAVLVPVGAAIAAAVPAILGVGNHLDARSGHDRRGPQRHRGDPRHVGGGGRPRRRSPRRSSRARRCRWQRSRESGSGCARWRSSRSWPCSSAGSPPPATRSTASATAGTASRAATASTAARRRSARQRPRQQPLRLLPRRARRIPRAPAAGDRSRQLPAAVSRPRPQR